MYIQVVRIGQAARISLREARHGETISWHDPRVVTKFTVVLAAVRGCEAVFDVTIPELHHIRVDYASMADVETHYGQLEPAIREVLGT